MRYMSEDAAREEFDSIMRDNYGDVTVCGMQMDALYVLKNMDEVAYDEAFNDYCDANDINIDDEEPEENDDFPMSMEYDDDRGEVDYL